MAKNVMPLNTVGAVSNYLARVWLMVCAVGQSCIPGCWEFLSWVVLQLNIAFLLSICLIKQLLCVLVIDQR